MRPPPTSLALYQRPPSAHETTLVAKLSPGVASVNSRRLAETERNRRIHTRIHTKKVFS